VDIPLGFSKVLCELCDEKSVIYVKMPGGPVFFVHGKKMKYNNEII
jgi:hypothetical protein